MREKRKIIIVGASGGVGSYGKAINPENLVISICSSKNAGFFKSLRADKVIEYKDKRAYDAFVDINVKGIFGIIFNCIVGEDHHQKLSPLLNKPIVFTHLLWEQPKILNCHTLGHLLQSFHFSVYIHIEMYLLNIAIRWWIPSFARTLYLSQKLHRCYKIKRFMHYC